MEYLFFDRFHDAVGKYKTDVRQLLVDCDEEFVPKLSARTTTTQKKLLITPTTTCDIEYYYEGLLKQSIILAIKNGDVVAFLSYINPYRCKEVNFNKCVYVSTIIVSKDHRGRGIAYDLYSALLNKFISSNKNLLPIVTRTWQSANPAYCNNLHISILENLKFSLKRTLKDQRGPGWD